MIVLLAHGSADPRHGGAVEGQAQRLRIHGLDVAVAYLDHQEPALGEVMTGCGGEVVVIPLLLSQAFHATVDVPREIAALDRADVSVRSGWLTDEVVVSALAQQCPPDLAPRDALVVITAGSSDAQAREADERRAHALGELVGTPARAAFASGPGRRPAAAIGAAREAGADRVHVLTALLAPGVLLDRALDDALPHLHHRDSVSDTTLLGGDVVTTALLAAALDQPSGLPSPRGTS